MVYPCTSNQASNNNNDPVNSFRRIFKALYFRVFTELTEPVTAFDETVFQEIVQQITVPSHTSICFHLIGGLNLTEKIPEQRRCRRK